MVKVSIIVPIYKVEDYLVRCLDSLVNQSFEDIEIILVDDGSPDNCPIICDEYAQKDNRIVVIHKQNGGVSAARNSGIEVAKGKYITFCDSDDYVDNDFVKTLVETIEKENTDSVSSNLHYLSKKYEPIKTNEITRYLLDSDDAKKDFLINKAKFKAGVWSVYNYIFKKDIIDKYNIRFNTKHSYSEDLDFVLKYHMHANSTAWIKSEIYFYEDIRNGSEMNRSLSKIRLEDMNGICLSVYDEYQKVFGEKEFYKLYHPMIYLQLYRILHLKKMKSLDNWVKIINELNEKSFFKNQISQFYENSSFDDYKDELGLLYGLGGRNVDKFITNENLSSFKMRYLIWKIISLPLKVFKKLFGK